MDQYLLIHKSILPENYEKVLRVRRLLERGEVKDVSQAVKTVGISRSTFYKYKDYILEPSELSAGQKAVLSMMLAHEPGVLSALLAQISSASCSVLTITQSPPIRGRASVTISLDMGGMKEPLTELMGTLGQIPGVDSLKLLAIE